MLSEGGLQCRGRLGRSTATDATGRSQKVEATLVPVAVLRSESTGPSVQHMLVRFDS